METTKFDFDIKEIRDNCRTLRASINRICDKYLPKEDETVFSPSLSHVSFVNRELLNCYDSLTSLMALYSHMEYLLIDNKFKIE